MSPVAPCRSQLETPAPRSRHSRGRRPAGWRPVEQQRSGAESHEGRRHEGRQQGGAKSDHAGTRQASDTQAGSMTLIRGTDSAVEEVRLHLGLQDIYDVGQRPDVLPGQAAGTLAQCAEVAGRVLVVPLAPARTGDRPPVLSGEAQDHAVMLPAWAPRQRVGAQVLPKADGRNRCVGLGSASSRVLEYPRPGWRAAQMTAIDQSRSV